MLEIRTMLLTLVPHWGLSTQSCLLRFHKYTVSILFKAYGMNKLFLFLFSSGPRARASTAESCCGWAGGSQWSGTTEQQSGWQRGGQRKPLLQVSRGETEYVKAEERRDAAAGSQVCWPLQCLCALPTTYWMSPQLPTPPTRLHMYFFGLYM